MSSLKLEPLALNTERRWLEEVRASLYRESRRGLDRMPKPSIARPLMVLIADLRNLRLAFERVCSNRGGNTPGVDGVKGCDFDSVKVREAFIRELRQELLNRVYEPQAIRRRWIPKSGKPELRPLGIPTLRDRCVQAAILNILDPVFEARTSNSVHGFRRGRNVISAAFDVIYHLNEIGKDSSHVGRSRTYQWVIEGDIKGFFDNLSHRKLLIRLRENLADDFVIKLIEKFLVAPNSDGRMLTIPSCGVPQGSLISPLLSNIALSALDQRYLSSRCEKHRSLVRYGDDFIVFVRGSKSKAEAEKAEIARLLEKEVGVELHPEKTKITKLSQSFEFLGYEFSKHDTPHGAEMRIPAKKEKQMRSRIESLLRLIASTTDECQRIETLELLDATLRGWAEYYARTENRLNVFSALDEQIKLGGVEGVPLSINYLALAEEKWNSQSQKGIRQ